MALDVSPPNVKKQGLAGFALLDHSWRAPLLLCSGILCCCTTPLALEVLCIFSPFCWVHAVLFAGSRFGSCLLGATVKGLKIHLFSGRRGIVVSNFLPRQRVTSQPNLDLSPCPPHVHPYQPRERPCPSPTWKDHCKPLVFVPYPLLCSPRLECPLSLVCSCPVVFLNNSSLGSLKSWLPESFLCFHGTSFMSGA